jgi:hypothetical protein
MRIIACDLHTRQQTMAMPDTTTGEVVEKTLTHQGSNQCAGVLFHAIRAGVRDSLRRSLSGLCWKLPRMGPTF